MLTIKLSSSNYLLWRNQVLPLLAYQKLTGYINGSISSPPPTIADAKSTAPKDNPAYLSWLASDQRALILLQSSLSEEAMAETLGHKTLVMYGSSIVAEFSRKFKAVCDLLTAIGHPLDETDKTHWFLCGLGLPSIPQLLLAPLGAVVTTTTVMVLLGVVVMVVVVSADSGASAHMTPSSSNLDSASTYSGNELVLFGNRNASSISNVGTSILSPNIALLDVLVVPHLTKSLLSISKLTMDNPVDVLFSN
ncbi:putative RNA-directed DNA polymerase [Tanacetum coccineum]|uniref:RNA-directed DNA polymerase n=1 Tax=Tanacetum coccineum TaxID=301880 RepID=A0ABQ5AJH0_9ASTR